MKLTNKILEAINRGINLALDDFDNEEEPIKNIKSKQVYNRDYTKDYLDLMKDVVDLGLPSGTLWCKNNLHDDTKSKYYDSYYSWGELESKNKDGWNNYKYCQGYNHLTKYCTKKMNGNIDGLSELLPEDDAAYQNLHVHNFKFHIPTKEQWEELIKYTNLDYDYHKGWTLTSTINGNQIDFPKQSNSMWKSWYWASTLNEVDNTCAYSIEFDESSIPTIDVKWRSSIIAIRPVVNL